MYRIIGASGVGWGGYYLGEEYRDKEVGREVLERRIRDAHPDPSHRANK